MSIPLNIDWQQILLHLFNFLILAGGLYILLYKPVKDFMDKRTAYYQSLENKVKEQLEKAEALEKDYAERLSQVDSEIREKRNSAAKEAEKRAAERMAEAENEVNKLFAEAKESAEYERQKMIASAKEEIVGLAAEAAKKIIDQSLGTTGGAEENGQ
ncbi:MAG: ATP synthase F0 subunit B [Eubacterium sp.]|nr:ATP synthase F0 subunit B [Eubacterium sp.]